MNHILTGAIPIIPTPFTENEDIDQESLCDLIEFAVASKLPAICLSAYSICF